MMNFDGKTNDEVFEEFQKLYEIGEKITIQILDLAVNSRSVDDKIAPSDALTVFYSGENDDFVKSFVENNPHIRNIKHTEAYAFIDDKRFKSILEDAVTNTYPGFTSDEIKNEINRRLRETSDNTKSPYISGIGYWTEVSRKFAEETRGDSYAFISRSSFEKIFGSDELRSLIESPSTDVKICCIDKELLKTQSLREAFETVKNSVISDLSESIEYYNSIGRKIGQNFTGTSLDGRFNDDPPDNYYFKTTLGEYLPYCDYERLNKKYPDLNGIQDYNKKSRISMSLIAYEYLKAHGVPDTELTHLKKEYDLYTRELHVINDKINSVSLSSTESKCKLSMRETQTNRLKLTETPKSRLQLRDSSSMMKSNIKKKKDIER